MDQLPQADTGNNTRQAPRNNIANATPMRVVHTEQPSSAVSSLTNNTTTTASIHDAPAPNPTINNNKRSTAPSTLEDTPSPKKKRPDFSKPLSDDKDYLSGDDEEEWGKEEEHNIRRINDPNCPDILAASVYDTKPAHLLSTSEETMEFEIDEAMIGYINN